MNTHHIRNGGTPSSEAILDTLVELLADRVADQVIERLNAAQSPRERTDTTLLSLDELVSELPPSKTPATWRRWMYERLRHGEIPGALKLGNRWFFRAAETRNWIREGAP